MKVAINGFGRIGRSFYKIASKNSEIEIVAINDLGDIENLAYLLKYDTVYGRFSSDISIKKEGDKNYIIVDDKKSLFLREKDPVNLLWKELGVDVVVESTGFFAAYEKSYAHILAGAKRVVISAPAKGGSSEITGKTVLMGINEEELSNCQISSNGSCTTNASSPVMKIMSETVGVKKAILNAVHGYTATQKTVDSPDAKDWRRGRAAAQNIIPSSTGAAISVTEGIESLKGIFDGIATRVPVPSGSIADITFLAKRKTSAEEINDIFKKAAKEERWQGILKVSEDPIVSSDIVGEPYPAIVDLGFTKVVGGDLVKVLSWYDNEMGYTYSLIKHVLKAGRLV